jgi:hypothetical protein
VQPRLVQHRQVVAPRGECRRRALVPGHEVVGVDELVLGLPSRPLAARPAAGTGSPGIPSLARIPNSSRGKKPALECGAICSHRRTPQSQWTYRDEEIATNTD